MTLGWAIAIFIGVPILVYVVGSLLAIMDGPRQ